MKTSTGENVVTLYSILGVDILASQEVIRHSYRKLARLYHPDRHQGCEDAKKKFQEIVAAFEVLSDEERRQQYDLDLLELLDVEEYLQRFQGLILTVCGLGLGMTTREEPMHTSEGLSGLQTKRWLLTAA
eukprot:CAMPEP_0202902312 /NCGR_PEP_ID=MMETSP1392-20130828/16785_1 /ASSEMBLY_ACC=CAM_ASM_000868 /TAXON_ID=225041 /ORGANISM="Chlamydomonas chlamydogama, Strain SAG 11-48b" /LENGTH=129 /DNA_ID=CAMNT_0049589061 /DNA_START=121 /DNA_END=510 /DNA_ORIENTATION=-